MSNRNVMKSKIRSVSYAICMGTTSTEERKERRARSGVALAFIILALGSFLDLNNYLSVVGILLSIIAIALLLIYRNYFTRKQKRAVYWSIFLYFTVSVIVIAGLVITAFSIVEGIVTAGVSFAIPPSEISSLFNTLLPFLVLNAAAADGLCYYLLVMRLLHRIDHAIYIGALSVSVTLRILVLLMTHSGTLPLPTEFQNYLSLVRLNIYDPYQFLLSIMASLILGVLLLYVALQVKRGKVLRI